MPRELPELIAAVAMLGVVVVLPLVFMFLRHQRAIASIIHDKTDGDTRRRIDALEQEVRNLKFELQVRSLESPDRRELHS